MLLALAGCGHKRRAARLPAPPPPIASAPYAREPGYKTFPPSTATAARPIGDSVEDLRYVAEHRPIWTQTGIASWYGPPYNRRKGANGEIFDQDHLSAAHRELPLGSLLRVTNTRTGQRSVMRVTDRGPFVPGRVLDLSLASAKAIGVWGPGTAPVSIEVFQAPKPIEEGGRWCVQIGAFRSEGKALALQKSLQRKYAAAQVIEFTGPTGHWVRIRPSGDDKAKAEEIEARVRPEEGAAYLTRLD